MGAPARQDTHPEHESVRDNLTLSVTDSAWLYEFFTFSLPTLYVRSVHLDMALQ